jgi:hypothetical protein
MIGSKTQEENRGIRVEGPGYQLRAGASHWGGGVSVNGVAAVRSALAHCHADGRFCLQLTLGVYGRRESQVAKQQSQLLKQMAAPEYERVPERVREENTEKAAKLEQELKAVADAISSLGSM